MKTLILGCNGQLGHSLHDTVAGEDEFVGLGPPELDITDAADLGERCRAISPDLIINAAAYTAVDKAESEVELCTAVNVEGARNVAAIAADIGARVIHISTDFVFDGASSMPYRPDVSTHPLGVYGRTKRDGELAALEASGGAAIIIRTSWLYSRYGNNFVKTMLRLMRERDELSVVSDQQGSPTWARSLAEAIWAFAGSTGTRGIYHWSDAGETSWHGFALAIQQEAISLGLLDKKIPLHAIGSADYPTPAARPQYSVLDCSSSHEAINIQAAHWRENLKEMLKGMTD